MYHPTTGQALAVERIRSLVAHADHFRAVREASHAVPAQPRHVTYRPAVPRDAQALARLAVLDDSTVPAGDVLVAEVAGIVVAALGSYGHAVADPFTPTAALVDNLRSLHPAGSPLPRALGRPFRAHGVAVEA